MELQRLLEIEFFKPLGVGNVPGKLTVVHANAPAVFNQLGTAGDLLVWVVWR